MKGKQLFCYSDSNIKLYSDTVVSKKKCDENVFLLTGFCCLRNSIIFLQLVWRRLNESYFSILDD